MLLAALVSGCGSGGSLFGGANVPGGGAPTQPNAPVNGGGLGTLKVDLIFPSTPTKIASAVNVDFPATTTVTVHVLDTTTHRDVVPPVTTPRPPGAQQMSVSVPGLEPGTYAVFVECFDAQGNSAGFSIPTATVVANETVAVEVTGTVTVTQLAISPATSTIASGGTQQYTLIASFSDSSPPQNVTFVASWTSSSTGVATVDGSGLATGVAGGTTTITASLGASSASAQLTVTGGAPTPTPTPTPTPPSVWNVQGTTQLTGPQQSAARVAVSADGTKATAIWQVFPNAGIQSASATIVGNVATWSAPVTIASSCNNGQLALSADGTRATVLFQESGVSTVKSVSASITGNAASWAQPVVVSDVPTSPAFIREPRVALSADGTKATASWTYLTDENANDYYGAGKIQSASATIDNQGAATWTSPVDLTDGAAGNYVDGPRVALSAAGTQALVVWNRATANGTTPGNFVVESRTATISGSTVTWSANASTLSDAGAGKNADNVSVGLSADGTTAIAVWRFNTQSPLASLDGSKLQSATASISANAATWSSPVDVTTATGGIGYNYTFVALSADGSKATAAWTRGPGGAGLVQTRSATISGNVPAWGATTTDIAVDPTQTAYAPIVALSADGSRAVLVWGEVYTGSSAAIHAVEATIVGNDATWGAITHLTLAQGNGSDQNVGLSADGTKATAAWIWNNGSSSPLLRLLRPPGAVACLTLTIHKRASRRVSRRRGRRGAVFRARQRQRGRALSLKYA